MMKFGGFKASLNIFNAKRHSRDHDEFEPGLCISGAYRTNRDEYFGNDRVYEPPKKLTPSMVKLPQCQETAPDIRPTKSSADLTTANNNLPANLRYSTPNVSLDPRGEERTKKSSRNDKPPAVSNVNQEKEDAKVKKKQLAEQKAREKLAAKEQAKQEKLAKAKEKKEAKDKAKIKKKEKKVRPPVAKPEQQGTSTITATTIVGQPKSANPLAQPQQQSTSSITATTIVGQPRSANPLAQGSNYTTNTLESSISKSSGPPPYTEEPQTNPNQNNPEPVFKTVPKPSTKKTAPKPKESESTNDVTFSEPIDTGTWDMVTQHRLQVSKTTSTVVQKKQRVMDLNYNMHDDKNNTDA